MDATLIHKKVRGLKTLALFYFSGEFVTMGALTDRFDRRMRDYPEELVGIYTRRASVTQIEEDMEWILKMNGSWTGSPQTP